MSLLGGATVVSVVMAIRHRKSRPLHILIAVAAAFFVVLVFSDRWTGVVSNSFGPQMMPVVAAQSWDFFGRFSAVLFRTWWFALGWARYFAPSWWMVVAATLVLVAVVGVVRRFAGTDAPTRTWMTLATAVIGVQVLAVYWTFFRAAVGPQGRYLFPVMVPTLLLLWVGIEACTPVRYRRYAAVGLVFLFALLDSAAWLLVGLPVYGI